MSTPSTGQVEAFMIIPLSHTLLIPEGCFTFLFISVLLSNSDIRAVFQRIGPYRNIAQGIAQTFCLRYNLTSSDGLDVVWMDKNHVQGLAHILSARK